MPHQANIRIIQSAMDRIELRVDKWMINLEKNGNMSADQIDQ
jgi:3-oxoacyl-[acyl-carrier-protein] synthase-3